VDIPAQKDIYTFGTMGMVLQLLRLPDGTVKARIEGKQRAKIESFVPTPIFHGDCGENTQRTRVGRGIPGLDESGGGKL